MTDRLPMHYQEAVDFFTYVKLYAPDFPARDGMTCKKAISKLFEYLEEIDEFEQNSTAKQWLRVCRAELKRADKSFDEGEHSKARRTVASARDYLNNAAQRKPMATNFIAGEAGETQ